MESSKEYNFFETEIFCYIINVFTVTFDQLNVSFLNKITYWKKNHTLNHVYFVIQKRTKIWVNIVSKNQPILFCVVDIKPEFLKERFNTK